MDNIINGYLNLGNIEHGTIKFNFVSNKVYFDTPFVQKFDLPYRFMNGVPIGDKLILNHSDLHNLMKIIRKIKSDKTFRRFEFTDDHYSCFLFIKRMIQLEEEYIFSYFIAPKVDDFVPNYEVNRSVINLLSEISRTTYWYVDFSDGKENYYSSSGLYGSRGEVIHSSDSIYFSKLDDAVLENEDYRTLVDVVKKNVADCESGVIDSFRCQYPMKVNNEIIWVETMATAAIKDDRGKTKLLVGVDVIVSDNRPIDIETELFRQTIDSGLNNADIGYWLMTLKDGVKTFRYNAKLRELYGYGEHVSIISGPQDRYDDKFMVAKNRVLSKYPEYEVFFKEDEVVFNKLLDDHIESYRSVLPFLDEKESIVWLEARASVISRDSAGKVSGVAGVSVDVTELFESKMMETLFSKMKTVLNLANKQAIEMMEVLIWSIDYIEHPDGDYFYGNEQYIEKLGLTKNKNGLIHIKDYFDTIIESDEYSIDFEDIGEYTKKMKSGEINGFEGLVLKHKNKKTGEIIYGSHSAQVAQRNKNGNVELLSGFFIDVTTEVNEKRMRVELEESISEVRRFNRLAVQAGQLMVFNINYLDENKGHEIYANDYLVNKLGIPTDDNHFSYETYRDSVMMDEEGMRMFTEVDGMYVDVLKGNLNGVSNQLTKHKSFETGEVFYLSHNSHVEERSSNGKVISIGGFLRDVTQDILNEQKVQYLAEMDSLTDLYNRNKFEVVVKNIPYKEYAIILFDIDGLKLANDIYGHKTGDEVLKKFASMLRDVYADELSFRIGGDEFCVLMNTVDEIKINETLVEIENRMNELIVNDSVQTGVSIGYEIVSTLPFEQAFTFAENQMYRKKLSSRSSRKSKTLDTLMITLSEKTEETNEHCERLSLLAQETYKMMGFNRGSELYDIGLAAKLHDIGKITIPLEILNKPGKLTKEEYATVKKHSEAGYKIVFNIMNSDDIAEGVLYHHERYDGKGYPYGLKEYEIPLYARIISVCDAYDAMISRRPYSIEMNDDDAIRELEECSGSQFDPEVVNAFLKVLKQADLLDK